MPYLLSYVLSLLPYEGKWLYGMSFLLGAGLALGFAPLSWFWVAFFIFPPLLVRLQHIDFTYDAFFLGYWFGVGSFAAGLYWVGFSFFAQTAISPWMAPFAVLLLALVLGLFIGVVFAAFHATMTKGPEDILIFAFFWTLLELIRAYAFTGFPWNLLAYIWGGSEIMMQSASLMGPYALSFLTCVFVAFPMLLAMEPHKKRKQYLYGTGVIFIGLFLFGLLRLQQAEVTFEPNTNLRLVQANIPQIEKWEPERRLEHLRRYISLSNQPSETGKDVTHVIWPEAALTFFLDEAGQAQRSIYNALENHPVLITGVPRAVREEDGTHYYNSMIVLNEVNEIEMTYDKQRLVPFGEYLPLRGIFSAIGLARMVAGPADISFGKPVTFQSVAGLPAFRPLICYEIIFPHAFYGHDNVDWILNLTNDGWFGDSSGPYQHLMMSRFRAVENGISVVRVAGTGISAVIDPWGRVISQISLNQQGIIDAQLPKKLENATLYAKVREWMILFLMVFSGITLFQNYRRNQG